MEKVPYSDVEKICNQNAVLEVFPPGAEKMMDILLEYFGKAATGKMPALQALEKAQQEITRLTTY
jgi:hypothetical protein